MRELLLSARLRGHVGSGALSARQIRKAGYVPAVLYGHGIENLLLAVDTRSFQKILPSVSSSTLLTLAVGESDTRRVLVQDIQHDPMTGSPTHIDFHQVTLTEKIRAKVPLRATGVAPAVKDHGGVLVQSVNEIEVEALPEDLPSEISVDLGKLSTFEDRITVADLAVPPGVEVHAKLDDVVAVVAPPRTEEELKAELEAAPAAAAVGEVKTEAETKKAAEEEKKTAEGEPAAEKKAEGKKEEKKK